MVVPIDTPGVTMVRNLPVFGDNDREGHAEILFEDVEVPRSALLGGEGDGFAISQARLGPDRIHHCMRSIRMAERALEGTALGKGDIQDWIAESRIEIEMIRLLTLKTAWLMETVGNQEARTEIVAIKVAAPRMALKVIDRAIQVHGAAGLTEDFPLAAYYAYQRVLRIADGPDEVHLRSIARAEIRQDRERAGKAGAGSKKAEDAGPVSATSSSVGSRVGS
jgi:acyl-CoA dehydrogenase